MAAGSGIPPGSRFLRAMPSCETVVDRIGFEYHPLSGSAKDMGSAAVLVTLVLMVGVWLCILL